MNNIKILISCHKETAYIKSDILKPIQLGCELSEERLPDMLYDNDGDNISALNPMYCELTAQYWAWKNMNADYYGFCHYRRYFNFSDTIYEEDEYGNVICPYLEKGAREKYGLDDKRMSDVILQYDIITTTRKDLHTLAGGYRSVIDQYEKAPMLCGKDIHTLLEIIDEKFPEYSRAAHEHCSGHITSFCNMYILKKEIFFDYCEWMFAVLEEFCKRTDMTHYSAEALRTPGHLSERLFGIYYLFLQENHPEYRKKELQCVFFEKTDPQDILKPAFKENSIPVVMAANNNFVPMFAACIRSLMDHMNVNNNYDIVLLQSDVTAENKNTLVDMVKQYENVSLRFFDAAQLLTNYKLKANAHISVETYYRFLIQDVLPDYDKILYIDCDIIVNADVADLYHTDIEGYMLAATRDPDFLGQINGANAETRKYCEEEFVMKDPYNYFQAGVLLLNTKEMRAAYSLDEWLTFASHPFKYNDQDVLNLYCEGHVKYLDMSWNMLTDCDHYRVNNVIAYAPADILDEYKKAHANPKMIHYAGFMKPWHRPNEDYAQLFWTTLRRTPYYEELLYRMMDGVAYWSIYENVTKNKNGRGLVRKIVNRVLPKNTRRRRLVKKMMGK